MRYEDENFDVAICEFEPGVRDYISLEGLEKESTGPTDSDLKRYERFFQKLLNEYFSSYIKEEEQVEDQNVDMTSAVNKFYAEKNPKRKTGRYDSYVEKVYNNLGLAVVTYDGGDFNENYGCIDANGNLVIPRIYQISMEYGDGLFATYDYSLSGGYIDTKGKKVIPFQYLVVGAFKNGFATVETYDNEFHLIDKTGRSVIRITHYSKDLEDEEKVMKKER